MITLTAKIHLNSTIPNPFVIGRSVIGGTDLIGSYLIGEINFNNHNTVSLERSIFDRSDTKLPSYGIISNTASLEFNDANSKFLGYAISGMLNQGIKVEFFINNTLYKNSEKVGEFFSSNWEYDNDNRSVSVSLKDDLEEWQDIQVQGFDYDPRKPFEIIGEGRFHNIYKWVWGKTPNKYQMLDYDSLDETTKGILYATKINYPLLKSGTLWEQWQKLCEVCGLYIYKNNKGKVVCTYTYGS